MAYEPPEDLVDLQVRFSRSTRSATASTATSSRPPVPSGWTWSCASTGTPGGARSRTGSRPTWRCARSPRRGCSPPPQG